MSDSLRDVIYDAMGRPGDWEQGVIQPSQFELDNYSHWRAIAGDVARAITEAGWRPPLPEGASPWDAYVAAYRAHQETDPHGATAHPTAHHMHALEAALRVYDPPRAAAGHDTEADAWYIRVLDERVHHTTEHAPANLDWTRDGRLIGVELLGPLRREQLAHDGWYPAAMREHDRANAAELDRSAAARRAASWWEAAKTLNRWGTAHREAHRAALVEITNLTAVRGELAHQRDDHHARADAAEAKLRQVREVIAEDAETRTRFNVDTSTSYGPRFLNRIRAIVERESATRCVNDTNGDGDCAACAHNPNAPCRSASEEPTCACDRPVARCSCRIADLCKAAAAGEDHMIDNGLAVLRWLDHPPEAPDA